jgi:cell division septation protein DedD
MADEGFHEIQLNGKQLVFLFMAATVVAVVIFLCGVMVGRGVRVQRATLEAATAAAAVDPTAAVRPPIDAPPAPAVAEGGSPALQEDLSYPERLAAETPPVETLKSPAEPPARQPAADPVRTASRRTEPPSAPDAPRAPGAPKDGFTVQVAAVRERSEADTIARRLSLKGYDAYVQSPAAGAPRVFRVRVGRYADRRQAEVIAAKLQKEEQFKPWITR